jgi:hypothetical protein
MRTRNWISVVLIFVVAAISASPAAADKKGKGAGLYWLVYDIKVPGTFKVCTQSEVSVNPGACPVWNPDTSFFESGSLLRLRILNGKLQSTYSVVVNGINVADSLPQIRGVDSATTPQAPASAAPTPAPLAPLSPDEAGQFQLLKSALSRAAKIIDGAGLAVQGYEGDTPKAPDAAACAPRTDVNPKDVSVRAILGFAAALGADLGKCRAEPTLTEAEFNNLQERTDHLNQSVGALNALLTQVQPVMTAAQAEWQSYQQAESAFRTKFTTPSDEEKAYLQGGSNYVALKNKSDALGSVVNGIPGETAGISLTEASVFNNMNAIFDGFSSPRPIDIPIGQYSTGFVAEFEIRETANFVRYAFAGTGGNAAGGAPTPAPSGGGGMPSPVGVGGGGPVKPGGAGGAPQGNTPTQGQGAATPQGKFVDQGNFEVHKLYRANLVAGFFASTLETRNFGVSSTTGATPVTTATVGGHHPGQLHYFVGIDYYAFKRRDVFPGAMTGKDYAIPGILVGYGADQTNNFLLGLNWELKWGLTLGGGAHVGQEASLSAGTVPGVTPLGSATTPPMTNHTHLGAFVSVGFDLSVFKAAFGQAAGGGSAPSTASPSTSSASGGKSKGN